MTQRELQPLLAPRSVAVVGASDDPAKWGFGIARGVLRGAGRRRVHLVNDRATEVQGHATVPSLRELPEPVDCAVLVVPARAFEDVVEDGLARGVRAFVGITIGFAETGADGLALEQRVAARVRAAGAVLLGPNCMGVWSGHEAFDAAWLDQGQVPGPLAIVSQSGGLGVDFVSYGLEMALGLSHFVSIGTRPTWRPAISSRTSPATSACARSASTARTSATAAASCARSPRPGRRASR